MVSCFSTGARSPAISLYPQLISVFILPIVYRLQTPAFLDLRKAGIELIEQLVNYRRLIFRP